MGLLNNQTPRYIINADVDAAAAIAHSKMAALTASRAMVTDGSGVASASSVTSTEMGYLSGVTAQLRGNDWSAFARVSGSDFTTTNGTATNVTGLSFNIGANDIWIVRFRLFGGCSTANGVRSALTYPAACTVKANQLSTRAGSTGVQWENVWAVSGTLSSSSTPFWNLVSTAQSSIMEGLIVNGANAGTVQLQVAAHTGGDTVTVSQNSFLHAVRVA